MPYCVPSHRERGLIRPKPASLSESISCCVPVRPSPVTVRVAANRWRYEADVFRLLQDLSANLREKRADERTRTADLISLRVSSYAFTAVSRGFRKRSRKSYLPVMHFWIFADLRSGYCQSSVGNEIR